MGFRDTWQDELDDDHAETTANPAPLDGWGQRARAGLRARRQIHMILTMVICGPFGLISLLRVDIFQSLIGLLSISYGLYLFSVLTVRGLQLRPGTPGQSTIFHDVLEVGLYASLLSAGSGFWMGFVGEAFTRSEYQTETLALLKLHTTHAMFFSALGALALWFTLLLGVHHITLLLDARAQRV